MNRLLRHFFSISIVVLAAMASSVAADDSQQLNVLLIIADDLRPELSCYPGGRAHTPNLDKLASTGVRFDNAYCQFPLCNPSRSSLLTGRYPHSVGVLDSVHWFQATCPEAISLPRYFRQRGYVTLRAGKIFHGGLDDAEAWTVGGSPRNFQGDQRPAKIKVVGQSDYVRMIEGKGESLPDYQTASTAIDFLQQCHDGPFFLAVGLIGTHSPLIAPRADFERYPLESLTLPSNFAPRPTIPPGFPAASIPEKNLDLFVDRDATPDEAKAVIRAYLAATTFIDRQVGRVLDKLTELRLADKTIVVFTSDHGYHLGEYGKWSKHNSLFEVAARVPLLIRTPNRSDKAVVCQRSVQLIDLYPTLAELTGEPTLAGIEGKSLSPLLSDPSAMWDHAAFTFAGEGGQPTGGSMRYGPWRYTMWNEDEVRAVLCDLSDAEGESVNLAGSVEHSGVEAMLRDRLVKQMRNLSDRSSITDPHKQFDNAD